MMWKCKKLLKKLSYKFQIKKSKILYFMRHPVSPFIIINIVKKVYQVYINTLDKEPGSVLQQEK